MIVQIEIAFLLTAEAVELKSEDVVVWPLGLDS